MPSALCKASQGRQNQCRRFTFSRNKQICNECMHTTNSSRSILNDTDHTQSNANLFVSRKRVSTTPILTTLTRFAQCARHLLFNSDLGLLVRKRDSTTLILTTLTRFAQCAWHLLFDSDLGLLVKQDARRRELFVSRQLDSTTPL